MLMMRTSPTLRLSISVLIFFLVSLRCLAAPPAAPDAMTLVHELHTALGGAQLDATAGLELSGRYVLGGLRGTFEQTLDLQRGRDVLRYDVGLTRAEQATTREGGWWTDEKGLPTAQDAPDALADAVTQSYEDRNGWAYADPAVPVRYAGTRTEDGQRFDLLQMRPAGGRELTLWLDARTHLPARVVMRDALQTDSTTYFSDYRPVGGVWFAFRQRLSVGDPSTDIIMQVTQARVLAHTSDQAFAMPQRTFDDARLLGSSAPVHIRFSLRDGLIIVPVSLDGGPPLPFVLDSGSLSSLTPATARQLKLRAAGHLPLYGVGAEPIRVQLTHVGTLQLGPAELADQQLLVVPLPWTLTHRGEDEPPLAGLIGYELFRRFVVTIDYQHRELTLALPALAPGGAAAPGVTRTAALQRLPLRFDGRRPFVLASVDGVPGYFGIDTGDDGALTLFGRFFDTHRLPVALPGLQSGESGVGGAIPTLMTRVSTLSLGPLTLQRPLTQLNFAPSGAFASHLTGGNLGSKVLQNFLVTVDFPHRSLYLQPSGQFGEAMAYNRSGLAVRLDGAGLPVITIVDSGSPAALAGLKVGDRVVQINDQPQRGRDYYEVASQFDRPAGTQLQLQILRRGRPQRVSLTLRELLPPDATLQPVTAERAGEAAVRLRPIS
jgi:hypothetical protein